MMSNWQRNSLQVRRSLMVLDGERLPRRRRAGQAAPRPAPMLQVCAWSLVGLLAIAVLAFGAIDEWATMVFELGAALVFALWAVRQFQQRRIQITLFPASAGENHPAGWARVLAACGSLYLPALGFLWVVILQIALHRSAYEYATQYALLLYAAYGVVLLVATETFQDAELRRKLALVLVVLGSLYAMFAVLQNLSAPGKLYWRITPPHVASVYGSYVNRNHYAGLMEMLAPIPLVLAAGQLLDGSKRTLAAFAFVFMAGSIFLSASRGGMFAVTVEIVIFGFVLLSNPFHRQTAFGLLLLLVLLGGFLAYSSGGQITQRLRDRLRAGNVDRVAVTLDTLRLWQERPLLGWGLGTFESVYPHVRSFATDLDVDFAHDDYAQTLAETGIAGFACVVWLVLALLRRGSRRAAGWDLEWGPALSFGALLGCCGMLVHSLLDFNLQIPANAAFFYFLAVIATT